MRGVNLALQSSYVVTGPICSGGSLRDLVRNCETKVREEVHNWEPNKILSVGETYLVDYLVEEYKLDTPGRSSL